MNRGKRLLQRAQLWGRRHFAPEFRVQCQRPLERHGSAYGGWTIDPTDIDAGSIVYAFGAGQDISFDLSLIAAFGCQVYAFDPTPRSIAWIAGQVLPPEFHFFPFGIAAHDGLATFSPPINRDHISYTILSRPETAHEAIQVPVYRLRTIMRRLGHDHIDLLKMDVEGAEYELLDEIGQTDLEIGQLLVEFHHRFAAVGWRQTAAALKALDRAGYKRIYISRSGDTFSLLRSDR